MLDLVARAGVVAAVPLVGAALLWRFIRREHFIQGRLLVQKTLIGGALGVGAYYVEREFLGLTGLSIEAGEVGAGSAALAMFLFVAPLEEGAKAVALLPSYRSRRVVGSRPGLLFAAATAAGFAASEGVLLVVFGAHGWLDVFRLLVGAPAHLFCAGLWGYVIASSGRQTWFSGAWMLAVVVHGLYDHIVFGRGPGLLIAAFPLVLAMAALSYFALGQRGKDDAAAPSPAIVQALSEPPSLRVMRRALRQQDQPLMPHWIALGAFVTTGVVLVSLAGAIVMGHRLGVDFAAANEADLSSNGPLILLGGATTLAFPFAGFLVARASATHSVLEPAMGALLAIAAVVAILSLTAPVAVVFALAVAPIAFGLACGGAWFGIGR